MAGMTRFVVMSPMPMTSHFSIPVCRPQIRARYQSLSASVRTFPCVVTVQSSVRNGGAGSPALL